nr:hypothetical protein Iba_chr15aCG11720 [Ipomoea batatas]
MLQIQFSRSLATRCKNGQACGCCVEKTSYLEDRDFSLLVYIRWIRKTWVQRYVQLTLMGEATSDREGKICDWAHPEDSTESIDLAKREEYRFGEVGGIEAGENLVD